MWRRLYFELCKCKCSCTCICENIEYLAATINDSVIICYEIINGADSVLTNTTNITNTISANVTGTVPINFGDKNARYKTDLFIFCTQFLVIIIVVKLLLVTVVIFCHYTKQNRIGALAL